MIFLKTVSFEIRVWLTGGFTYGRLHLREASLREICA